MDIDICGQDSPNHSINTSFELSTPIRKIKYLTLNSPKDSKSPLYPSLDDIVISPPDKENYHARTNMASSMLNKGYSKKLTNNVLAELNSRANEISKSIKSPPSDRTHRTIQQRRHKRYSGIHWSKFNKMESISDHYSVSQYDTMEIDHHDNVHEAIHEMHHNTSPSKISPSKSESDESHNKRRRTLNGPDEILNYQASTTVSPEKTLASSPIRKISPSKGLMNLNQILKSDDDPDLAGSPGKSRFAKPFPPSSKLRASSLEMAGVLTKNIPQLNKKPSIPTLSTKPSIPTLNKKPSIPQLQKKLSIPQLQKKPSTTNLQGSPHAQNFSFSNPPNFQHTLQKKTSIPKLQRKSSIPSLAPNSMPAPPKPTTMKPPSSMLSPRPPKHFNSISPLKSSTSLKSGLPPLRSTTAINPSLSPLRSSNSISPLKSTNSIKSYTQPSFARPTTSSTFGSRPVKRGVTPSSSMNSVSGRETPKKFTIPQQNTLYDKPTISSSQKSLNKFQKFKERFN